MENGFYRYKLLNFITTKYAMLLVDNVLYWYIIIQIILLV